jgi:hypothetical protein
MKTLKLLPLLLLILGLTISACKKDDDPEPEPPKPNMSVEFAGGQNSITYPSQTNIDVQIVFKAEKLIKRVYYKEPQANGSHIERDITIRMGPNHDIMAMDKAEATYYFQRSDAEINALMSSQTKAYFEFTVEDKEGNKESAKFTITKTSGTFLTKEITNGELYHYAGTLAGGWDLENDTKVGTSAAPSTMYMMNTDGSGSTFTASWKSNPANATKFVKASSNFDYAHATEEAASSEYNSGTPSTSVSSPQNGEMYIAMKNNVYYVIKVLNVDPNYSAGTGANTGQLKFSYKKK